MSRWIENNAQWYEQRMLHCGCCGRLIAKHFLLADVGAEQKIFCSGACEGVYRDYVLVERGPNYLPPANVRNLYEERMVK